MPATILPPLFLLLPLKTPEQEYVEVLQKPVKVVRVSLQLLRKVIQVKTKFKKIVDFLILNYLKNYNRSRNVKKEI